MNVLKGLALAFLSFLLFLSLLVFALAFTLNSTVLSTGFFNDQIERLPISAIVDEVISEKADEEDFPESFRQSLSNTLPQVEQQLEAEVSGIIDDVLAYLKGESSSLDLRLTLAESFLNADFIISLLDEFDLPALAEDFVGDQFLDDLPEDIAILIGDPGQMVAGIVADLEPWLREQAEIVIPPVVDYILGKTQDLSVVIPLDILKETIRDNLWEEISALSTEDLKDIFWEQFQESTPQELKEIMWPIFLDSLPPELAGLPPYQLEPYFESYIQGLSQEEADLYLDEFFAQFPLNELEAEFNDYFDEFLGLFPASAEIDQETIGSEIPADINEALSEAEETLTDAREYIGYFLAGYWVVIALILLTVAGIILIKRDVKSSSRGLGITFLIVGIMQYIGIFIFKSLADSNIPPPDTDLPTAVQSWLPQLFDDVLAPLEMLSIGFAVAGVILVIVSLFYRRQAAEA